MKNARNKLAEVDKEVTDELIRRARKILRDHPNLDEFVMGMGTWFFTIRDGDMLDDKTKYLKPIDDLMQEWNDTLHLTGDPMRFTADGEIVTDW